MAMEQVCPVVNIPASRAPDKFVDDIKKKELIERTVFRAKWRKFGADDDENIWET